VVREKKSLKGKVDASQPATDDGRTDGRTDGRMPAPSGQVS